MSYSVIFLLYSYLFEPRNNVRQLLSPRRFDQTSFMRLCECWSNFTIASLDWTLNLRFFFHISYESKSHNKRELLFSKDKWVFVDCVEGHKKWEKWLTNLSCSSFRDRFVLKEIVNVEAKDDPKKGTRYLLELVSCYYDLSDNQSNTWWPPVSL